MASILSRLLPHSSPPEPLRPGLYHTLAPQDAAQPYRLHLRVESDGNGILIVNAATVLHLNPSATEHALLMIQGKTEEEASRTIASRFRVTRRRALADHQALRARILTIATTPEIDPVLFLDIDRTDPYPDDLSAPVRLDLALTYRTAPGAATDPRARRRVDRELTTDEWKTILEKAWQAGVPHVTFTGGEPTLREDLIALISHAQKLGQVSGLLTDGRKLADSTYLSALSQAGLDHILVTLDPSDASSMDGLKAAIASDVFTAAHVTLSARESTDVPSLLDQLRSLSLPAVSFSAAEETPELVTRLGEARAAAARLGISLIWDLPAPYSSRNPMALELEKSIQGAGRAFLYVEPDGDVLPGQGIDRLLGNLLRDEWQAIWRAAKQPA
jgi:organic radical activating enzyme